MPVPVTILSVQPEPDGHIYGPFTVTLSGSVSVDDVVNHLVVRSDTVNFEVKSSPTFGVYNGNEKFYELEINGSTITVTDRTGSHGAPIQDFEWQ